MKIFSRKVRMPKPARIDHPGAPALEWLGDVSGRSVRIAAKGSRCVLIENHTGILDFTEESVRMATASGPLQIRGENLSLSEVRENALIVRGCIRQIDLPQDGGEA